jgi:hypothetical protein
MGTSDEHERPKTVSEPSDEGDGLEPERSSTDAAGEAARHRGGGMKHSDKRTIKPAILWLAAMAAIVVTARSGRPAEAARGVCDPRPRELAVVFCDDFDGT